MKEKVGDNLIDFSFTVILRLESINLVIRFRNTSFVSILNESNIISSQHFSQIFFNLALILLIQTNTE